MERSDSLLEGDGAAVASGGEFACSRRFCADFAFNRSRSRCSSSSTSVMFMDPWNVPCVSVFFVSKGGDSIWIDSRCSLFEKRKDDETACCFLYNGETSRLPFVRRPCNATVRIGNTDHDTSPSTSQEIERHLGNTFCFRHNLSDGTNIRYNGEEALGRSNSNLAGAVRGHWPTIHSHFGGGSWKGSSTQSASNHDQMFCAKST